MSRAVKDYLCWFLRCFFGYGVINGDLFESGLRGHLPPHEVAHHAPAVLRLEMIGLQRVDGP